jgi:hypothetical protein
MGVGVANRAVGGFDGSGNPEDWEAFEGQMAQPDVTSGLSDRGARYLLGEGQDAPWGREVGQQRLQNLGQFGRTGIRGERIASLTTKTTLIALGRTGLVRQQED